MANEGGGKREHADPLAMLNLVSLCPQPILPASGPEVLGAPWRPGRPRRHVELDAIKAHYESNVKVKAEIIVYYRLLLL